MSASLLGPYLEKTMVRRLFSQDDICSAIFFLDNFCLITPRFTEYSLWLIDIERIFLIRNWTELRLNFRYTKRSVILYLFSELWYLLHAFSTIHIYLQYHDICFWSHTSRSTKSLLTGISYTLYILIAKFQARAKCKSHRSYVMLFC